MSKGLASTPSTGSEPAAARRLKPADMATIGTRATSSLSLDLIFWVGAEVQQLYQDAGVELEKYQGNQSHFLPMAAKFIVGQDGLVKARQVNIEFRERMEPEAIIASLETLRAG